MKLQTVPKTMNKKISKNDILYEYGTMRGALINVLSIWMRRLHYCKEQYSIKQTKKLEGEIIQLNSCIHDAKRYVLDGVELKEYIPDYSPKLETEILIEIKSEDKLGKAVALNKL